jgi:hypothetical protein
MTPKAPIAQLAMLMASCLFCIVIADKWAQHALPSSRMVLFLTFLGMPVFGAVLGFVVSGVANTMFRAGPPKLRVPFTASVWLTFCGLLSIWLLQGRSYDHDRLVPLIAIASFCGLIVGPYYAELFVGAWFYKRSLKLIGAQRDQKMVEIERDGVRRQAHLQRRFEEEKAARLNAQERPNAIRNYFRS